MERGTLVKILAGELKDSEGIVVAHYAYNTTDVVEVQFLKVVEGIGLTGRKGYTATFPTEDVEIIAEPKLYEVFRYSEDHESCVMCDNKYVFLSDYEIGYLFSSFHKETALNAHVLYTGKTTGRFMHNKVYRISDGFIFNLPEDTRVDELTDLDNIMGSGNWMEVF